MIINPTAGLDKSVLNVLNHIFHPAGVDWDFSLTHKSVAVKRLAVKAAASSVDIVSAYGGGNSQMGIANVLLCTGILPAI